MERFYNCFLILLTLILSFHLSSQSEKIPCPKTCSCRDSNPSSTSPGGLQIQCKPGSNSVIPEVDPSVAFFDLSGGNYLTLDASTFRATQRIENLLLNNSRVQNIEIGTFSGMPKLRFLSLAGNQFSTIDVDAFVKLRSKNLKGELIFNVAR